MKGYIEDLKEMLSSISSPEIAAGQSAYLRNKFDFYGIKTPQRRECIRPYLMKQNLPEKNKLHAIVKALWQKPQREIQHTAQELAHKYIGDLDKQDITLFEYMVTEKSWWDTVDFIAVNLMGPYFKQFPGEIEEHIEKWIASKNIWLQRSALLFQLKFKDQLDTIILENTILKLKDTSEFFINKAIGWVLREYGKTNPQYVVEFCEKTKLSNLSRKEALKHISSQPSRPAG